MPVYDTDIEDVIEEEEGFVGKGGFGEEEENMEDIVVVANDLCSSMIQTTLSVDFSKTIDSNPHELIWSQKGNLVDVSILIGKKYQEGYLKAKPMDDKLGFKTIKPTLSEIKIDDVGPLTPLIGFSGQIIWPIGKIQLLVKIGDEEHSTSAWMNFVVVRSPSPYNGIIRRPGVRKLQAILSTAHGMLKLPVEEGVITLKSSRLVPLECAMVSGPKGIPPATKPIIEERVKVAINPEHPEQTVMIGSTLTEEGRNKLCGLF
ncbi:hypothetical protein Tco_0838762 [Tanacetum coccineum]|uniref:Reverse transcriptase domain-containing protein n=1 Tax=Tanacetum coccineum TaxID=301880 RepID=A0ABQ5ANQ6_9ASTR